MDATATLSYLFFEDCKRAADRFEHICGLVTAQTPETDWLDFKCRPPKDVNAKEIWYKALAGFANTEGGVLVWGIEASKQPDGKDVASGICLVDDPRAFESRLRELQRQGTNPPLTKVEYLSVEDPANAGRGFVVCLVPESAFKPHRAEVPEKPQYYIRAGDSFQVPSPSLLRQMFHPKYQPTFRAEVCLMASASQSVDGVRHMPMSCTVRLHNDGNASAYECIVRPNINQVGRAIAEPMGTGWQLFPWSSTEHALRSTLPIHPGFLSEVCTLNWTARTITANTSDRQRFMPDLGDGDFLFETTIFAKDMSPQRIVVRFDKDLFRTGYCHWGSGTADSA